MGFSSQFVMNVGCACSFEVGKHTTCLLTKAFVGWHNLKVFALLPPVRSVVYVPVLGWWVGRVPSRLLPVLAPAVFSCDSGLTLCGSHADKARIWWVAISKLIVFAFVWFLAAAPDDVFMSKTADRV